jgi:chemotaxis protein CheC
MQPILTDAQRHLLRMIFDRGAEGGSQALSKWLAEEVHLAVSEVEMVELEQASELLCP